MSFTTKKKTIDILQWQAISNDIKTKKLQDLSKKTIKTHPSRIEEERFLWRYHPARHSVPKNVHAARLSVMPTLPKKQEDVFTCIGELNHLTNNNEDLFSICGSRSQIVFGSRSIYKFLCSVDTVFYGRYISIFKQTFCTVFHNLCILNYLSYWIPYVKILIDFELAIHNADKVMEQKVEIIGCRFHCFQTWYWKIQSLGLISNNLSENQVGKYLKLFFSLPFPKPVLHFIFIPKKDVLGNQKLIEFCNYLGCLEEILLSFNDTH